MAYVDSLAATKLEEAAVNHDRSPSTAASKGPRMDILIVADDRLLAMSLEATLDLGGHITLGPATTATSALSLAEVNRPDLALVHLGLQGGGQGLAGKLRDWFAVPSLLVGPATACTPADRVAAWGLIGEPCGSRTILKAVGIAAALGECRRPRGRLPRQIELFHRPERLRDRRTAASARGPAAMEVSGIRSYP